MFEFVKDLIKAAQVTSGVESINEELNKLSNTADNCVSDVERLKRDIRNMERLRWRNFKW